MGRSFSQSLSLHPDSLVSGCWRVVDRGDSPPSAKMPSGPSEKTSSATGTV